MPPATTARNLATGNAAMPASANLAANIACGLLANASGGDARR
jgi:hypothetical protein